VEIRRGEVADRSAAIAAQIGRQPKAASPIASIVITCFNYGNLVEEAVASATAQTLQPIDVIVADDESTVRIIRYPGPLLHH
jgi:cellulose synthase/poly-beta-1,6-N-acetylglucosamine synthase-like glycosyltransferase